MRLRRMSVLLAALVAPGANGPARAGDAADVRQLKEETEQLDQMVKVLQRKRELEQESTAEKAKTTPLVYFVPGGFQVRSADSNFPFRVRGYPTLLVPNRGVGVQVQGDLSQAVVSSRVQFQL